MTTPNTQQTSQPQNLQEILDYLLTIPSDEELISTTAKENTKSKVNMIYGLGGQLGYLKGQNRLEKIGYTESLLKPVLDSYTQLFGGEFSGFGRVESAFYKASYSMSEYKSLPIQAIFYGSIRISDATSSGVLYDARYGGPYRFDIISYDDQQFFQERFLEFLSYDSNIQVLILRYLELYTKYVKYPTESLDRYKAMLDRIFTMARNESDQLQELIFTMQNAKARVIDLL